MGKPKILLTPGPCLTSESVRQAASGPDLNHRDPEYLQLVQESKSRLMSVYPGLKAGWHPFLLGGSGTLAVEAMVTSCVKAGPVLILENGYYSSRIREIFEIHNIPYRALSFGWLSAWDFDEIRKELGKGYEAVVGTHNETTTGRLNDISQLGQLCREFGADCLIDAMSSFGADEIDFSNLDAVCASGNKCLHSIPGVAFVLANDTMRLHMTQVHRRSYYMSLPIYEGDNPPLTPPVPALAALRQALREYPPGGAATRRADYNEKASFLRQELSARGMNSAIPVAELSCTLTTVELPKGVSFDQWFQLNNAEGYVLYGCKGELRDHYYQVSNMGELTMENLVSWIKCIDQLLV